MSEIKPNPRLLSLLEQLTNPIKQINFQIKINGAYCFPDEWRVSDESNPGVFGYRVQVLNQTIDGGKIYPREQTDKEKRDQEELLNVYKGQNIFLLLKNQAKQKKGGKKDTKEQSNPEEEERLQRLKQQEEENEKIRLQYFNELSPQEQIYYVYEDRYKNISLRFDDNTKACIIDGNLWEQLEDQIYNKGQMQIQFIRYPLINEDEIGKLKKTKPKNLNLADLQQVVYRSTLSLRQFQDPGIQRIKQRCFLQQVEESVDVPKYNMEKCYLNLEINLDPAPTALIEEVRPTVKELYEINRKDIQKAPSKNDCLNQFTSDVNLAMLSLSNEYQILFAKDGNEQKNKISTTMTVQKKQELQKKKEQFLLDINQTGKYKLLKDRLRNSIVKLCIDKFQKEGLYSGVTKDDKDRLFAELYVYMMEEMQKILADFIATRKEDIHEDLVQSFEQNIKDRDRVYSNLTKESDEERFQRLANEYELLNIHHQCIKYYNNLISVQPTNHQFLYSYARFCLRIQDFKKAEQLLFRAIQIQDSDEYKQLLILLYIQRERYKEALNMVDKLLKLSPKSTLLNNLMAFIYRLQDNIKMSDKYKHVTERIYMRTRGLLTTRRLLFLFQRIYLIKISLKNTPQNPHILPNLRQQTLELQELAKKAPQITNEQSDFLQLELIEHFAKYNLMELVEKASQSIIDKSTLKMTIMKAQVLTYKKNYPEALTIYNKFLSQNPKNFDVHMLKGQVCYTTGQFYEAEETFLKAQRIKQTKSLNIYLRLGYLYLKRKSWQDAKISLQHSIEISNNSSLSWLGLGIATLRLGELKLAEECLAQANIYEPFNGEVWGYIALLCLIQEKRLQQALQSIKRMEDTEVYDFELLEELGDQLYVSKNYEQANELYHRILKYQIEDKNLGVLHLKIGKVFASLNEQKKAKEHYQISLLKLEGENEKQAVRQQIEIIENY